MSDSDWTSVADAADFLPGTVREIITAGRVIAVVRTDDAVYAVDGVCPHAGGPLGEGRLEGCVLTCPWHGWQFDIRSGQHTLSPALSQPTFEARIADGRIQVRVHGRGTD